MNFKDSITLSTYSDNANKQFNEIKNRLSEIENSFQTRMNGKTTGGLTGALIGTVLWLAAFIIGAILVRPMVNGTLLLIALLIAIGLIVFMLIDNIMDFSYYGEIASYKNAVSQLQNRVNVGQSSIKANHDAFMGSKVRGWNYLLSAAPSIPNEATSIETTMTGMESLKKGFINNAKNVFFFASVIAVTVVGCVALFPVGGNIIEGIIGENISNDTLTVLNVIAMILVGVGAVILAKMMWSKTDCNVTGTTLFVIVLAPIAYIALCAIATLVVKLVIWAVSIFLAILAVVVVGGIVFACTSGG